jgi:DNA-binding transcriptional LysR family regulator
VFLEHARTVLAAVDRAVDATRAEASHSRGVETTSGGTTCESEGRLASPQASV